MLTEQLPLGAKAKARKEKPAAPLSEAALLGLLRERYPAKEYALLPHVRNATGFSMRTTRTADALALSLWPSRGIELLGFEVKSARGDFLREKRDPAKAEEIARFCDRWWLVAGADGLVQLDELPPTWGLLVPRAGKLVAVREASKLDAQPLTRAQLAAILRVAAEHVPPVVRDDDVELRIREAVNEARADWERGNRIALERSEKELEKLQERVRAFEQASGIQIFDWRGRNVGAAVRLVLNGGMESMRTDLERVRMYAAQLAQHAEAALAAVAERPGAEKEAAS